MLRLRPSPNVRIAPLVADRKRLAIWIKTVRILFWISNAPTPKDINKECHTPSIYRMFEVWHSLLYISNCLCLLVFLFLNDGIDDSHGSDVDDVTHAAFEVGEVDRLLQSHLNWADNFGIFSHRLNHLV